MGARTICERTDGRAYKSARVQVGTRTSRRAYTPLVNLEIFNSNKTRYSEIENEISIKGLN